MFEGFSRGKVSVEGTEIAFVTGGSGPPALLLHGFPQNLAMWARVAPLMAIHHTVVCADLRGYGDSSKPKRRADSSNYSFRSTGQMAQLFDIPAEWRKRLVNMTEASLPGGHFFVDQFPVQTAAILSDFLARARS
jgi:pimeloyl-ACP methyl ester carboxylesterase